MGSCPGVEAAAPPLQVLFIGNSYIYANDLPGEFARLACAGGHKVSTGMLAQGGWRLEDHAASSQTFEKLREQEWDVVILQEQSELPAVKSVRTQSMLPAVRQLGAEITAVGAQPILFMTWGHRDGSPNTGDRTHQDMQKSLTAGYMSVASELNIPLAPVGVAWYQVWSQPDPPDLWQADGSHPNIKGTYLAACVFYAVIFRESPHGLVYPRGLTQGETQALQKVAADTALNFQW